MGNQPKKAPKAARTGAPLTRRQQKHQRRAPKQQRQAQTMPPARQELRHQPQMRVTTRPADTPQPAVHLDAGTVAAPASDTIRDEDVTTMVTDIEAEPAETATTSVRSVRGKEATAAQSAQHEATPPRSRNPRGAARRKADVPAETPSAEPISTEPLEEESATTPATPVARKQSPRQGTKYPTLARMAAIAPASPLNTDPLPSGDLPAAPFAATSTHDAEVEAAETVEMRSPSATRADHTGNTGNTGSAGDTDASRAAARDAAAEPRESREPQPRATFEPRKPVTTRRLSDEPRSASHASSDATARRLESAAAKAVAGAREARRQASQTSKSTSMRRPRSLPEIDLVLPVAAGHIIVTFAAALTGIILMIVGQEGYPWPFALAIVLGIGASLAYTASQRRTAKSFAGSALLASQVAALGWLFALLGARASLLALTPAMLLLAMRTAGRLALVLGGAAVFALYIAAGLVVPALPISQPVLSPTQHAVTDGVVVFVGLFTLLVMALDLQHGRTQALAHARASRHEARLLRERTALLRQQLEEDAALLDEGLVEALLGHGIDPAAMDQVDSMLSPLVERVIAVADRLETLQRDREDRLRLEGAVRQVTRALERGWLGLTWSWPDASGTLLDELVALLRAPNPRQMPLWRDDTPPTLVPIPSLDAGLTPRPWGGFDTPAANQYMRPDPRMAWPAITNRPSLPDDSDQHLIAGHGISGLGWPAPVSGETYAQQPAPEHRPSYARANPLPWDEWDTWGTWDASARDS